MLYTHDKSSFCTVRKTIPQKDSRRKHRPQHVPRHWRLLSVVLVYNSHLWPRHALWTWDKNTSVFYLFRQKEDEAAANVSGTCLTRNCHDLPWIKLDLASRLGPHLRSARSSSQQERFRKPTHLFREILMSIPDSNLFSEGPYIGVEIYSSSQPLIKFIVPCSIK